MALTLFAIYTDAGLTTLLSDNLDFSHFEDGSSGNIDKVVYLGSTDATVQLTTKVNPALDQIVISITDVDPAANTPKPADAKLALSLAGLDASVAGAALNLGSTILGGVANAVAVYIRGTQADGNGVGGGTPDLTFDTNELSQTVI